MCVALTAHIEGRDGARTLAFGDLHRLPGDRPDLDTVLAPGELITAIGLPLGFAARPHDVAEPPLLSQRRSIVPKAVGAAIILVRVLLGRRIAPVAPL